ncbi:MAG: M24 family metallopeptidase [Gemmatimonadota bacterium]
MLKRVALLAAAILFSPHFSQAQHAPRNDSNILPIRGRAELQFEFTQKRLDTLLPRLMRETGFDMWIITGNEDNHDPVFWTMMPYENWSPITQILVLYDRGPELGVERLNLSRTNTRGLFENGWDAGAWDRGEGESQWESLGRVVRERDPERIGINVGEIQWVAGGLTVVLKKKLVEAIGPEYASRLVSAEPLATLWSETLLPEEVDVWERAVAVSHGIIADMFSSAGATPGFTTTEDLRYYYWQRVADLGLAISFMPSVSVRGRSPENREKYGAADNVIRPGDLLHCDVGLKYLHYNTDHQEMAYVLRVGETDAPETFKRLMAEANRLQDVFVGELKTGLTGNELLNNMLTRAHAEGIPGPRIYSHSLGYFLHEPGPLIGLPWEQEHNPGRGDVKLVPMSGFTVELSVTGPVPEWGGQDFRLPLEQDIIFLGDRSVFLDGRQSRFHLIR